MDRKSYLQFISLFFEVTPLVALLGPRQCGKTTLANSYAEKALVQGIEVTKFDSGSRLTN